MANNFTEKANFIWSVANLIRDDFKRGESGFVTASVIGPFGNILGLMYNPHYVEVLSSRTA